MRTKSGKFICCHLTGGTIPAKVFSVIHRRGLKIQHLLFAGIIGFSFFPSKSTAQTIPRQFLHDHVPPVVSGLTPLGTLAPSTRLNLAIGLPLRDESGLDDLLRQIYDPASSNYRHYLTPEQFTKMFGPTEQDYQKVIDFARANGLTVTATHPNRVVLEVSATAADIARAFHVTMRTYRHPTENRNFFAPDVEPSIDLAVPISHISGLDDYSPPRPRIIKKTPVENLANAIPQAGLGPGGTYAGNDFRAAYIPGVTLTGTGQSVGLLEFDGYYASDITSYESISGLAGVTLTNVAVNGGVSTPGGGNDEVALDIDMAMAMAPGLSKIVVYEAPGSTSWASMLSAIVADTNNFPKQISCSWGLNSPGSTDPISEGLFKQLATQGQSFFNASGDSDAFTASGIPFPSESTNITQVGGTTLSTTGARGAWILETAWNWGSGSGTGGGVSTHYGIPAWQQGINMTANQGSTTKRNVPDVAMTADNIFVVADNGVHYSIGGTSCAAPLWAAFTALVNQQAIAGGQTNVGFINPALYAIGKGTGYSSDFNDIVTGNNLWSSSTSKFSAVPGYDLCTGWGTPASDDLIDALAGVSDALAVAPGKGFVAFGPVGGAFTAGAQIFTLTNSGIAPLNWSLINTSSWLNASAAGGTLTAGGAAANVTVGLNAAAYNLPAGTYIANVLFTNTTSHAVRDRQFVLLAGKQLVQNGGFESGFLSYWMQTGSGGKFNGYNNDYVDNNGTNSGVLPHSGSYLAVFGAANTTGYISQMIPTVPGQAYLLSFWLTNSIGGSTQQFFANWNTNTIFNLLNPGAFGWTNPVYIVIATSTNTLLQFGARNDPNYFGLDDVSVIAIPVPTIKTFAKTNNLLTFTWNSLATIQYQLQSLTNLAQTNWVNLGNVINASGVITSTNIPISPDPQRFYRIYQLP